MILDNYLNESQESCKHDTWWIRWRRCECPWLLQPTYLYSSLFLLAPPNDPSHVRFPRSHSRKTSSTSSYVRCFRHSRDACYRERIETKRARKRKEWERKKERDVQPMANSIIPWFLWEGVRKSASMFAAWSSGIILYEWQSWNRIYPHSELDLVRMYVCSFLIWMVSYKVTSKRSAKI